VTISQDAVTAATESTVSFVIGGVLAATGVILWLTAPGGDVKEHAIAVMPIASPRDIGAGIAGRW
jgi:hypothetical protein